MAELDEQVAALSQHPPVVLFTQHSLTAADLQFNLSKKETIRSKRQIGLEELQNALNQDLFVTLIVKEEGKSNAPRRELSLSQRKKKPKKGDRAEETKSLSPAKKTDPISPAKPLETHKPAAAKTANPLLARKSLESSPVKPIKSRESSRSSGSVMDNLKLIAAIALKLAKSPDKSDTKSQVSDTFSSVSSESPKKTDGSNKPKRALPAIYESVHESTPPHLSPEPVPLRSHLSDPFRARLVHSVAFSSPNEHSPGPNFSTSLSAPRSPGKALDPRTSANPILRHYGRMYGIKDSFWTVMKLAESVKRKKAEERSVEEGILGRRSETPISSQSFRTYDLAHISFDRALNSRGFSPFRCTKRDIPSSLSHRPPSMC